MATRQEKSVFITIPKKGKAKECSNYCTIALISHASKIMLRLLQAKLQQYMNQELPDVLPGLEQWTGSKLEKEYDKAVYCHHAYLT